MKNKEKEDVKMNNGTVLDCQAWGGLYKKFRTRLVNSLSSSYCRADREDAVEFAFDKLMHRKDAVAYGDRFPRTEKDWFWNLYWQSRSFLSHMKHRSGLHAKYVESMSKEFEGAFDSGLQGVDMDAETCSEALARALEIFRVEQGISRRDLNVFVLRQRFQTPSKEIAVRYGITVSNVDVIRHRVGKLLRKHGPDCYARALCRAA